jgi:hypothetical protein
MPLQSAALRVAVLPAACLEAAVIASPPHVAELFSRCPVRTRRERAVEPWGLLAPGDEEDQDEHDREDDGLGRHRRSGIAADKNSPRRDGIPPGRNPSGTESLRDGIPPGRNPSGTESLRDGIPPGRNRRRSGRASGRAL